ncbi:hypothetical protein ACLMNJ_16345 [Streptomyces seoulensis]
MATEELVTQQDSEAAVTRRLLRAADDAELGHMQWQDHGMALLHARRPDRLLQHVTEQLTVIAAAANCPCACAVAGTQQSVLFTEPVSGPALSELLLLTRPAFVTTGVPVALPKQDDWPDAADLSVYAAARNCHVAEPRWRSETVALHHHLPGVASGVLRLSGRQRLLCAGTVSPAMGSLARTVSLDRHEPKRRAERIGRVMTPRQKAACWGVPRWKVGSGGPYGVSGTEDAGRILRSCRPCVDALVGVGS